MVSKIISGGQTGADRAALDAAIELGIPYGGWLPKGRLTEAGPLPEKYALQEMPSESYEARTEQNVKDSDGTLIVSYGGLTGGSACTREMAARHGRPCLHLDLSATSAFAAVKAVRYWLERHRVEVLNVAGPRQSKDPKVYAAVRKLLLSVFHLDIVSTQMPDPERANPLIPATVAEAVQNLTAAMTLRDKSSVAKMKKEELDRLNSTLGRYIREKYGLWSVNKALLNACRAQAGKDDLSVDEVSGVIIGALWEELQQTHRLRVVA